MLHVLPKTTNRKELIYKNKIYYVWDSDDLILEKVSGEDILNAVNSDISFNNILVQNGVVYVMNDTSIKKISSLWRKGLSALKPMYKVVDLAELSTLVILRNDEVYIVYYFGIDENHCMPVLYRNELSFILAYENSWGDLESLTIDYLGKCNIKTIEKEVLLQPKKLLKMDVKKTLRSI